MAATSASVCAPRFFVITAFDAQFVMTFRTDQEIVLAEFGLEAPVSASKMVNQRFVGQIRGPAGHAFLPGIQPGGTAIGTGVQSIEEHAGEVAGIGHSLRATAGILDQAAHRVDHAIPDAGIVNRFDDPLARVGPGEKDRLGGVAHPHLFGDRSDKPGDPRELFDGPGHGFRGPRGRLEVGEWKRRARQVRHRRQIVVRLADNRPDVLDTLAVEDNDSVEAAFGAKHERAGEPHGELARRGGQNQEPWGIPGIVGHAIGTGEGKIHGG